MLGVRSISRNNVAYFLSGVGCGHHMYRLIPNVQNEVARIWAIRSVDINNLAFYDSAYNLGAGDATLQKTLQRMLVPVYTSLRCGFTQHLTVELFRNRNAPFGISAVQHGSIFNPTHYRHHRFDGPAKAPNSVRTRGV